MKFISRNRKIYYGMDLFKLKLIVTKPIQLVEGSRNTFIALKNQFFVG